MKQALGIELCRDDASQLGSMSRSPPLPQLVRAANR